MSQNRAPQDLSAGVAELVDALDSKSGAPKGRVGSSPTSGTTPASRARVEPSSGKIALPYATAGMTIPPALHSCRVAVHGEETGA